MQKQLFLYEAAIGLGISVGPLLGGMLGAISWRGPFLGVAALMVIAIENRYGLSGALLPILIRTEVIQV